MLEQTKKLAIVCIHLLIIISAPIGVMQDGLFLMIQNNCMNSLSPTSSLLPQSSLIDDACNSIAVLVTLMIWNNKFALEVKLPRHTSTLKIFHYHWNIQCLHNWLDTFFVHVLKQWWTSPFHNIKFTLCVDLTVFFLNILNLFRWFPIRPIEAISSCFVRLETKLSGWKSLL